MVAMATDHVVNPQIWPQTNLQYEYVNKGVTFQQLDFKLFVAGKLEIISSKNIGDKEKKARVALLKNVYYSSVYHWIDNLSMLNHSLKCGQAEELSG
jgi:hypothetical protein